MSKKDGRLTQQFWWPGEWLFMDKTKAMWFLECKHLLNDSCHLTHFLAGNELSVIMAGAWHQTPTSTSTTLLQRMQAPPKRQLSLDPLSGRKWAICRLGRMQAPPKRQLSLDPLSGRKWAICRLRKVQGSFSQNCDDSGATVCRCFFTCYVNVVSTRVIHIRMYPGLRRWAPKWNRVTYGTKPFDAHTRENNWVQQSSYWPHARRNKYENKRNTHFALSSGNVGTSDIYGSLLSSCISIFFIYIHIHMINTTDVSTQITTVQTTNISTHTRRVCGIHTMCALHTTWQEKWMKNMYHDVRNITW